MTDIGKAFDRKFGGAEMLPGQKKRYRHSFARKGEEHQFSHVMRLTPNQETFCKYLSLDAYTDKGRMLCELIVKLVQEQNRIKVGEIRLLDFVRVERHITEVDGHMSDPIEGPFPIVGNWEHMRGFSGVGYYRVSWRFRDRTCTVEVDPRYDLHKLSAKDIVRCKYNAAMNMAAGTAKDISRLHDTLDKQLQEAGEDVFIYELLQNANDYPNGNEKVDVEFRIEDNHGTGYLVFCHTGAVFSAANVAAICSANDEDKASNLKAIGYKGIGFKTVFRFNDRAEVHSGEYGFAFDKDTQKTKAYIPWRTTPIWIEPKCTLGYRVEIRLVPHDRNLLNQGCGYAAQLERLFADERPLLFIPNVRSVKIKTSSNGEPIIREVREDRWCVSGQMEVRVDEAIRKEINETLQDVEHCRIPRKYKDLENTAVSFACRHNGRRLMPENSACLYCYLPAKDADWGFRFLMNTDMIPNGPRNNIEYSIGVNKYFTRVAGGKFFDWIDSLIRSGQYEYDSIFGLIPDFDECKNNRPPKVVEFIQEFQGGFESRVAELQIPSSKGNLVPASSIVYDSTGILKELGESVWERLGYGSDIVVKSLRDSKDFDSFVKRYKTLLNIQEFGFDDLVQAVGNESFQKWIGNPIANQKFFKYLDGKGELELFKYSKIFLDDKRMLGAPQDMYYNADVEKYLKPFADCFRYLPSSAPCRDKVDEKWFKSLDPQVIVCKEIFSPATEHQMLAKLQSITNAKMLFAFIATHRKHQVACRRNYRYKAGTYIAYIEEECFSVDFLQRLPVVHDNGTITDIGAGECSLFFPQEAGSKELLNRFVWIDEKWIGFLNKEYFEGEEGETIRTLLEGKNLIHPWSTKGIFNAIVIKFMENIRCRMVDARSDLGFYDFIFECLNDQVVDHGWITKKLSGWPVLCANGELIESQGKVIFYNNDEILRWVKNGRLDEAVSVLNEKYSTQQELFNLWGTKEYKEDNFGEIFRTFLAAHLNLDSREKVVAFHRFMATKNNLLNANQAAELKKAPILVNGGVNPVVGFDGVYLPAEIDIGSDIASGIVSDEIKFLDDALCDDGTMEYWKWLGVKSLDEVEILKKRLEKYLERQKEFVEKGANDVDFKEYHTSFISALASGGALQMLKDNGCGDLIKIVRLFSKGGELLLPVEMKWSNEFQPLCDFESFDSDGVYVSEMYCGIAGIKELFEELGVKDKFLKSDVGLLANKEFCEYFWKKYLPLNESEWNEIKDYLKADLSCVMDRAGIVRKPEELCHLDIEAYVLKLPNCESKLPMVDGIGKERLSQLGMKKNLSVGDSLAFLLADSDCKMYKMRGKVLEWIAKGEASTTDAHGLVDKYRSDERAKWRNGLKDPVSVKELCAIRRKNSGQIRLFANDPHVMDLTGLGIAGDGADAMRTEVENALVWLGVQLVDDGSIEIEPSNEHVISDQVISDIAVRMLVFLAERYPDGWEQEFSAGYSRLKDFKFIKCSGLIVRCKDNDWLRAEHGTFLSKGDSVYFVDDWQSKFVYGDMVAELWEKAYKKQYSLDDLKMALDTSGGDYQLSKRIALDKKNLLDDEQFVQKLQEQFPKVYSMVCDRLCEKECAPTPSTYSENDGQGVVEDAQSSGEEKEQSKALLHEPETKRNYSEDEQEQMFRIFGNGLTVDQMNDENRLVCIRLFNSLKAQGYEPRMLEADFVRDVYNNKKTFRASTIETNDGRQIHVISARKGVAYLPPRWWTRLAKPNNTKYVVCAVLNHLPDGFKYFRSRNDLLTAIGDNLGVIRVHGETAGSRLDRTLRLFEFDPELSDFSIYSLLRVKATCDYDAAFREDMEFAESIGREMGAEEEQGNNAY